MSLYPDPQANQNEAPDPGQADEIFELELTAMAHGGSALGRHANRTIFVPYAIPGERITARLTQDKGRFAHAQGIALLDSSAARVYPRCPHFGPGRCGGCHWQHIDYDAQLAFKREVMADQLARIGGFVDAVVHPPIPSPDPWQYRSHVTFHITEAGQAGFVATDDQHIIPIEECHIIRPELLDLFDSLDIEALETPNLARVRLQVGTASDELLIVLSTVDDEIPSVEIEQDVSVSFLSSGGSPLALIGGGCVHYIIQERTFRVTAGSFFQVNLPQTAALVDLVLARLDLAGHESVLDLYSGVGLFSAFIAGRAALVTAVESYVPAVDDADFNLATFDNIDLIEGSVEHTLPELDGPFDAAVLDPPRTGLELAAVRALADLAPPKIVYVSCDPATLARDARRLAERGYHLLDVQPVDMFPQTYHIEAVATLARR